MTQTQVETPAAESRTGPAPFAWTPERRRTMLEMWAGGSTMKVIGEAIGTSRNAVSGRLTKMGLFGDGGRDRAREVLAGETRDGSVGEPKIAQGKPKPKTKSTPKTEPVAMEQAEPNREDDGPVGNAAMDTRDDGMGDPAVPAAEDARPANAQYDGVRVAIRPGEAETLAAGGDLRGIIGDDRTAEFLEAFSRMFQPDLDDDTHARHARREALIAIHDGVPGLISTRSAAGREIASMQRCVVREDSLEATTDTLGYLVMGGEAGLYHEWGGEPDILVLLADTLQRGE